MASDQAYLRISGDRLWASASPTRNPDILRDSQSWVTNSLEVKALFALKRDGLLQVETLVQSEMTRRFFAEVFRDESDHDFAPALEFACAVNSLATVRMGSLSYPLGSNFWSQLENMGYI